jgi:hypothetical protein
MPLSKVGPSLSRFSLVHTGRFVMTLHTEFRENLTNDLAVDIILQMDGWGLHVRFFFKVNKERL